MSGWVSTVGWWLRVLPFVFAAVAVTAVVGCSSSSPRDINYGTDAGAGYEPPASEVESDGGDGQDGEAGETGATGQGGAGGEADGGTPDTSTTDGAND